MVEFRTRAPGNHNTGDSGGVSLDGHLQKVWQNIRNDPELKMEMLRTMKENGIDPRLIKAVFPDIGEVANVEPAQEQATETPEAPETKIVTEKPTPDQLIGFIDDLKDILPQGGETSLQDLQEMAANNPDIVETAIEMRF